MCAFRTSLSHACVKLHLGSTVPYDPARCATPIHTSIHPCTYTPHMSTYTHTCIHIHHITHQCPTYMYMYTTSHTTHVQHITHTTHIHTSHTTHVHTSHTTHVHIRHYISRLHTPSLHTLGCGQRPDARIGAQWRRTPPSSSNPRREPIRACQGRRGTEPQPGHPSPAPESHWRGALCSSSRE